MDAAEWLDWWVLEALEPYGARRDDLRIAVLAQVLLQALGATKAKGAPFLAADFLRLLDVDTPSSGPASTPVTQTAAQMEARLEMWIRGSNRSLAERQGGRRARA